MSANAERFGKAVRDRREELDLSQLDVWHADGPSNTTLTVIENGRLTKLSRNVARKLDAALRWEPGSARRVWEGGDPTPLPEPARDPGHDSEPGDDPDELIQAVERSRLPEADKHYIIGVIEATVRRVRDERRDLGRGRG